MSDAGCLQEFVKKDQHARERYFDNKERRAKYIYKYTPHRDNFRAEYTCGRGKRFDKCTTFHAIAWTALAPAPLRGCLVDVGVQYRLWHPPFAGNTTIRYFI